MYDLCTQINSAQKRDKIASILATAAAAAAAAQFDQIPPCTVEPFFRLPSSALKTLFSEFGGVLDYFVETEGGFYLYAQFTTETIDPNSPFAVLSLTLDLINDSDLTVYLTGAKIPPGGSYIGLPLADQLKAFADSHGNGVVQDSIILLDGQQVYIYIGPTPGHVAADSGQFSTINFMNGNFANFQGVCGDKVA